MGSKGRVGGGGVTTITFSPKRFLSSTSSSRRCMISRFNGSSADRNAASWRLRERGRGRRLLVEGV